MGVILGGLGGAAAGFVLGAVLALLVMGWLGVSDFEGKRGTAAFLLFGPLGALAGIGLGVWVALRLTAGATGAGGIARGSALTVVALVVVAGIAVAAMWMRTDRPLNPNGPAPRLAFEIRVPADAGLIDAGTRLRVTLDTDRNQMPADLAPDAPRREGAWLVVAGEVDLYFRTSRRLVVLDLGNGRQQLFDPRLSAAPATSADWSPWRRVDYVFTSPDQTRGARPGPGDRSELRSLVRAD